MEDLLEKRGNNRHRRRIDGLKKQPLNDSIEEEIEAEAVRQLRRQGRMARVPEYGPMNSPIKRIVKPCAREIGDTGWSEVRLKKLF